MISIDEAIRRLRADPLCASLVEEAYLEEDLSGAADRFHRSSEFKEVLALMGKDLTGRRVLDLGAGRGIASFAFAKHAPEAVYALDPDPSEDVGWGASSRLRPGLPIQIVGGVGEGIPLLDGRVDIVYTRQVLHHTTDLRQTLRECARVLAEGGLLVATREHVVDDEDQLRSFLENHPIHRLAGGENAYPLQDYLSAIQDAGLEVLRILGPWDSVVNAYPAVDSDEELKAFPTALLKRKLGRAGGVLSRLPAVEQMVWRRLKRPVPGRLYSFVARKLAG